MAELFPQHTGAQRLHDSGLKYETKQHDYTAAHADFGQALELLSGEPASLSRDVQIARIKRDDGFTYVREAVKGKRELFVPAVDQLVASRKLLDFAVNDRLVESFEERRKYLLAERGATISCLARLALAEEIQGMGSLGGEDAIRLHEIASHDLSAGTNRYYETSNAMTAARAELLAGNSHQEISEWLGLAIISAGRSLVNDRKNSKGSFETLASRSRHLRSTKAAILSVKSHP